MFRLNAWVFFRRKWSIQSKHRQGFPILSLYQRTPFSVYAGANWEAATSWWQGLGKRLTVLQLPGVSILQSVQVRDPFAMKLHPQEVGVLTVVHKWNHRYKICDIPMERNQAYRQVKRVARSRQSWSQDDPRDHHKVHSRVSRAALIAKWSLPWHHGY